MSTGPTLDIDLAEITDLDLLELAHWFAQPSIASRAPHLCDWLLSGVILPEHHRRLRGDQDEAAKIPTLDTRRWPNHAVAAALVFSQRLSFDALPPAVAMFSDQLTRAALEAAVDRLLVHGNYIPPEGDFDAETN